jgi:small GTP-binding protein
MALLGNSFVGKTCLMNNFISKTASMYYRPTFGCEISHTQLRVDGELCKLTIRDTAGQEALNSVVPFYCRNVHGAIIVFSIIDEKSFAALPKWINFLHDNAPTASILIFGNKSDLAAERTISEEQAEKFCLERGFPYIEGSVMTGQNVSNAFTVITKECKKQIWMPYPPFPTPSPKPHPFCQC